MIRNAGCACALVVVAGLAVPVAAQQRDGGIGASVAAGLAVELLKGIAGEAVRDGGIRVYSKAQTDGPDDDDFAYGSDYDSMQILEYELDSYTGEVRSAQRPRHVAEAYIHYHYKDGAWRPHDYWSGSRYEGSHMEYVIANKDSTPVKNSDNRTRAAAVNAFAENGTIIKEYKKEEENLNGKAREIGTRVSSAALGGMYFSPDRFTFNDAGGGMVRIERARGADAVDVLHSHVNVGGRAAFASPMLVEGNSLSSDLLTDTFSEIANDSNGFAGEASGRADLTITGATLSFGSGVYSSTDAHGNPRSQADLLREYLADPNAVQIVAPDQAQEGYAPNVVFRTVVTGNEVVDLSSLDPTFQNVLPSGVYQSVGDDGLPNAAPIEMVGIIFAVSGALEDAMNLAAATPGSFFYDTFRQMLDGDFYELDGVFASTSAMFRDAETTVIIPAPASLVVIGLATVGMTRRRR